MPQTKSFAVCLLLLFALFGNRVGADPVLGPAVEQNGLRFESWLASPTLDVPDRNLVPRKNIPVRLLSVRVTNMTQMSTRLSPYALNAIVTGPDGKQLSADVLRINGYIRQPQESDYILLLPGQTLMLPNFGSFFWKDGHLCLSLPSGFDGHPFVHEGQIVGDNTSGSTPAEKIRTLMFGKHQGLSPGTYQFSLHYIMRSSTVAICDDHTARIIKTLDGFWTGDVTLPPVKFALVEPTPAHAPAPPATGRARDNKDVEGR